MPYLEQFTTADSNGNPGLIPPCPQHVNSYSFAANEVKAIAIPVNARYAVFSKIGGDFAMAAISANANGRSTPAVYPSGTSETGTACEVNPTQRRVDSDITGLSIAAGSTAILMTISWYS